MCNKLKTVWLWIRGWNSTTVIQFITYFIGIITFVTATEYFSAAPFLKTRLYVFPPDIYVDRVLVREFYSRSKIEVPPWLIEDSFFRELFAKPVVKNNFSETDFNNPLWEITHSPPIKEVTTEFESSLKRQNWYNDIFSHKVPFYGTDFKKCLERLDSAKINLSPRDYRNFVVSLLYARTFSNDIHITNDGDIDLRDIIITIFAPSTRTTESRENNILSFESDTIHPNVIKEYKDKVEIYLPTLKIRHGHSISIKTRESKINEQDVLSSFQYDRSVKYQRTWLVVMITLFLMVLVKLICRGKHI